MRTVTFERLAHGGVAGTSEGTLAELVAAIPYLVVPGGVIPPLEVINDLLGRGIADAGMSGGCRWQPFQVGDDEWRELVSALEAQGCELVQPAEWVHTFEDWATWRMARQLGIPPGDQRELKRLQDEEARWRRASAQAGEQGNHDRMLECHLKAVRAGTESAAIVERYKR